MVVADDLSLFFHSCLELKCIKRAGWVSKVQVEDAETVADHTFSMATMAMLLSDMPGDVVAQQKLAKEKKAMKSILSGLPKEIRDEYEKIWLEYLHNRTEIARFVHRIDKLEMALQANQYAKQGYADKLLAPFFESAETALGDAGDIVSEIIKSLRPALAKK